MPSIAIPLSLRGQLLNGALLSEWILATGLWSDVSRWDDGSIWNDGV